MCPREKGFVLWGHCQNLLDDPRMCRNSDPFPKSRNQNLTIPFFSNSLISLTGAGFLAFSLFSFDVKKNNHSNSYGSPSFKEYSIVVKASWLSLFSHILR